MFAGFLSLSMLFSERAAAQGTPIFDDISTDTTWTIAGSPYWIEDGITVLQKVNLTIEPGVMVRFNGLYDLYVDGNFTAVGTETARINITSNRSLPAPRDWWGIEINSTGHAEIKYCDISYGYDGIRLSSSSYNNITNNNIYSNHQDGIDLYKSTNNYIANNNISSNGWRGIYLYFSSDNNITNNNFINDGVIVEGFLSDFHSLNIPPNNIVNEKPLYYYKDCNGINIDGISVGQLILANCTNVDVKNLQINNTAVGIEVAHSMNITITNNNLSNNFRGILLIYSSNNMITNNNVSNNDYGIIVGRSYNNVSGNYVSSNYWTGISAGSYNNITNNWVVSNQYGISVGSNNNIMENNVSNNECGISLSLSSYNNVASNNISMNNSVGISLYSSSNNIIINNNISNNHDGIRFESSSNNNIINNNVSTNKDEGIYLYKSSTNNITNNKIYSNAGNGTRFWLSSNNNISNNNFLNDGVFIEGGLSHFNSHYIPTNNIVNGKPLYYYKDCSGIDIDGLQVGQLIFANCTGINIKNLQINNTDAGIEIAHSRNINIINNNVTNNRVSVFLYTSKNINITNNNVSNNEYGIYLKSSSSNNIIIDNNVLSNSNYGIYLWSSSNNNITNNNVSNNENGIFLKRSSNNIISNNNFTNDGLVMIGFDVSHFNSHNIPTNNIVNGKPLYYYKNCSDIDIDGISIGQLILANCTDVDVKNLQVNNTDVGIEVAFSRNITIINNNFCSNDWGGIYLYSSSNNNITNNNVLNNGYGIYFMSSSNNNTITDNNVSWNYKHGIFLWISSNDNIITNNNVSNNEGGIYLIGSSLNNIIINNNVNSNKGDGIYLYTSSDNVITNNNVSYNDYGIRFDSLNTNNMIINNYVTSNNWYGIYLFSSSNNMIYHNNIIDNVNQAFDNTDDNVWNDIYPSGGNYWSDWALPDVLSGPNQDIPSNDGIVDSPYFIDADSIDYYPLMYPFDSIPIITNVSITPNPQEIYSYINISAMIIDYTDGIIVSINITKPNCSWQNESMHNIGITYYLNRSYDIIGSYSFTIWASDTSNNWNFKIGEFDIIDNTDPIILDVIINPGLQEIYGNVNISASVDDNYLVSEVWLNIASPRGIVSNTSMKYDSVNDRYYLNTSYFKVGTYTFTVFAFDSSNNCDSFSGQFEIIDTASPTISVISSPSSSLTNQSNKIFVYVSDNGGVSEIRINYVDVNGMKHNETMSLIDGIYYSFSIPAQTSEGTIMYFIWANDTSGNSAITNEYTITINAPVAEIRLSDTSWVFYVFLALYVFAFILISIYYIQRKRE